MNNIKIKSYRFPRFHTEHSSMEPIRKVKKKHKSYQNGSHFISQYSRIVDSLEQNTFKRNFSPHSPSHQSYSINKILKLPSITNHYSQPKIKTRSKKQYPLNPIKIRRPLQFSSSVHESSQVKLNIQFTQIKPLIRHFNNLLDVSLNINQSQFQIFSATKSYILEKKQSSIAEFDELFLREEDKDLLKRFILLQRLAVIGFIYSIAQDPNNNIKASMRHILDAIIGVYLYILIKVNQFPSSKDYSNLISTLINNVQMQGIHLKKDFVSTIFFLLKKIPLLFNKNQFLAYVLNTQYLKVSSLSIQKSFYDLLTNFAIYLNLHQEIILNNKGTMDSFSTCPAPYLFAQTDKKYTLVLQYQGILLTRMLKKDYVLLRPFCQQFLGTLAKYYQIIIFTVYMPNEAQPLLKNLPNIEHCLYRYHTVRIKDKMYKDLSRIGRSMSKLIAIDNSVNDQYIFQQENVLYIHPWHGDPNDCDLLKLKQYLLTITEKEEIDVRKSIQNIKNSSKK